MAKVLLVEDDAALVEMISDWLSFEHYQVEAVSSGKEGMERLKFYNYDVVVLDWSVPEITGVEICRQFRHGGGVTPILILTGKNAVSEKETGLDAGADDYLTKPFHMKELSARLRALLRRPAIQVASVLKAGEIELNPTTYRVIKNGEDISLLPMEFALLEFFMRHPNQVFSTEALLSFVWKADVDASDEALRTCMKRLRKKIDTEGAPSVIHNVRGVGYKLKA